MFATAAASAGSVDRAVTAITRERPWIRALTAPWTRVVTAARVRRSTASGDGGSGGVAGSAPEPDSAASHCRGIQARGFSQERIDRRGGRSFGLKAGSPARSSFSATLAARVREVRTRISLSIVARSVRSPRSTSSTSTTFVSGTPMRIFVRAEYRGVICETTRSVARVTSPTVARIRALWRSTRSTSSRNHRSPEDGSTPGQRRYASGSAASGIPGSVAGDGRPGASIR